MSKTITTLKEKDYYKGFNQFSVYDFKVPSFDENKEFIMMKNREVLHCHDSVMVLIYAQAIDSLIFCQQFRPGIYCHKGKDSPYPLECVAGSIDEEKRPDEIARQEALEEAGVELDELELILTAFGSPGVTTEKTHIYLGKVKGAPQSQIAGLLDHGEEILSHVITRERVFEMMDNMEFLDVKTLLALNWFRWKFAKK